MNEKVTKRHCDPDVLNSHANKNYSFANLFLKIKMKGSIQLKANTLALDRDP